MSLQILVMFPGETTLEELEKRLNQLKEIGCSYQFGDSAVDKPSTKAQVGRQFNQLLAPPPKKEEESSFINEKDRLTEDEEKLMDQALEITHRDGETKLLSELTEQKVGKGIVLKFNMTQEILSYFKENPGHNANQCAANLAEKFADRYGSVSTAFMRIKAIVYTVSYHHRNLKKHRSPSGFVAFSFVEN